MNVHFTIDADTGRWISVAPLSPEQGVRIAASVLPGITPEMIRTLLDITTGEPLPSPSLPEDRVRVFADALTSVDADYTPGPGGKQLHTLDLRDVLNELTAWRALAADRLKVIDALSKELALAQDPPRVEPSVPEFSVGDPDTTRERGPYCDAWSPNDYVCTREPHHGGTMHAAGMGEYIVDVWPIEPVDPAPQGDPITAEND